MLTPPMEILELKDGESLSFHVLAWLQDSATIADPDRPGVKGINVLRVTLSPVEKKLFPFYYDITSKGAIAQLLPFLQQPGFQSKLFTLTAHGFGVKKRYSLEVK